MRAKAGVRESLVVFRIAWAKAETTFVSGASELVMVAVPVSDLLGARVVRL